MTPSAYAPACRRVAGAVILSAVMAGAAHAQDRPVVFSLQGGPTIPLGVVRTPLRMGAHVAGGLTFGRPGSPIAVRAELIHTDVRLPQQYGIVCGPQTSCDRSSGISAATLSLVFSRAIMPARAGSPVVYAIAGVGYYDVPTPHFVVPPEASPAGDYEIDRQSRAGWNIGGGVLMPFGGFSLYLEARVHGVLSSNDRFVPISLGVSF